MYGDTDSLFVHLPGKTKEEAFRIGKDIAQKVTMLNPAPVKLKFEKVRRGLGSLTGTRLTSCPGLPPLRPRCEKAVRRLQVRRPTRPRARL